MADRTAGAIADVGEMLVVSSDEAVVAWSHARGLPVEPDPGSLNASASAIAARAESRPWMVLHADLPLLTAADLRVATKLLGERGAVIAPSYDGGTTLLAGAAPFQRFAYGPGSFVRHFAALPHAGVVIRPGLALDVDTPADLRSHGPRLPG